MRVRPSDEPFAQFVQIPCEYQIAADVSTGRLLTTWTFKSVVDIVLGGSIATNIVLRVE